MNEELIEKFEYMVEKHPDKVVEFAKKMYRQNPEEIEKMLHQAKTDGGHIANRRKYDDLIEKLKWSNGNGRGAKWSFEDIKKNSRINFNNVDYTEYDYAYLVNMLYAKCCKEYTDPSMFLKLAKCLLEDTDEETKLYHGAYAKKHSYSKHGEQAYYEDYPYEDRRRRYRSEYDTYDADDYPEEDRRGVRRYRNEYENKRVYGDDRFEPRNYYKETNMGF